MKRMWSKNELKEISGKQAQEEIQDVFPSPEVTDNGKVLGVNADGNYELKDPSAVNEVLMENVVDSNGNSRFIDGNVSPSNEIPSGDVKFAKWTLSGTHLMIVFAFLASEDKSLAGKTICALQLPQWVYNKIYPMNEGTDHIAVIDSIKGYIPSDLTPSTYSLRPYIYRDQQNHGIVMNGAGGTEIEDGHYYRIVFDLVID